MIAITSQAAANSLVLSGEVDRLRKRIALCEGLFDDYDSTMAQYDVVLSGKNEYISGLELVVDGYKKLLKDYKKLLGEPMFTFEGGIGATGSEKKPALMMGLGIRRFRIWGFMQESNSGAFVGTTFRLF
jgi:hypothetical protein